MEYDKRFVARAFLFIVVSSLTFSATPSKAFIGVGEEGFDELLMKIWTHNFYTDYVRTTLQGDESKVIKGLTARDGEDLRMDTDMRQYESKGEEDPMSQIMLWTGMIMLPDEEKTIMLFHVPEKFMIMRPGESKGAMPEGIPEGYPPAGKHGKPEKYVPPKVEMVKIREEKFDNHQTFVYKITVIWPDGKKREGKGWQAQDFESKPWVKLEVYYPEDEPDRTEVIELYNLKLGKPARSWFSPPPPYTEIKDYMELFGGMMGGMMPGFDG